MATLDGTLRLPTPTGEVANRADIYRIAVALLQDAGQYVSCTPMDVLNLAEFLATKD